MARRDWTVLTGLVLTAAAVQGLAAAGVAHVRGSATAYAYQSPDAAEYVAYARGLAWQCRYARLDHDGGQIASWPDTWRTPGYPAVLAVVVATFGDSTGVLLAFHQVLTLLTVPLLWLILRRCCSPRWALLGAIGWCLDPFRIYYSLWLMAETLFTLVLLVGVYMWALFMGRGWTIGRALAIGLIGGALVLIRPIALPLPILACAGIALSRRSWLEDETAGAGGAALIHCLRRPAGRGAAVLACILGTAVVITPWLHFNPSLQSSHGLTSQAGASLAYHKAADVMLWSQGRSAHRFDADALAEVRHEIDNRVREKWQQRYGPLRSTQRDDLRFERLNFGQTWFVDPFAASEILQQVAIEILRQHKLATVECFAAQGLGMLVFPLGLVLFPPVGTGPLSLLGGGSAAARLVAAGIGLVYAAFLAATLWRIVATIIRRRTPGGMFALVAALALFALSLPSEDPRFRLPLVPLFWIVAVAQSGRSARAEARGSLTESIAPSQATEDITHGAS